MAPIQIQDRAVMTLKDLDQLWPSLEDNEPLVFGISSVDQDAECYKMDHARRGKCVIFNHETYADGMGLKTRSGTYKDAEALEKCFQFLKFEVQVYDDLNAAEIDKIFVHLSREDHSDADCLVICVLSHGKEEAFAARDAWVHYLGMYQHFYGRNCLSLASKPKLFFVQACRGPEADLGVQMDYDMTDCSYGHIPSKSDMLTMFASAPGYKSFRKGGGSEFITTLVKVLTEDSHKHDLMTMLTKVSRKVSTTFISTNSKSQKRDKKKQQPSIETMLIRKIHFFPPNGNPKPWPHYFYDLVTRPFHNLQM